MPEIERESRIRLEGSSFEARRVLVDFITSDRWLLVRRNQLWSPPTDVYETDAGIVVVVELAGMQKEDFQVVLAGQTLTISGARHDPAAKQAFHQMEIRYGQFATQVHIPKPIIREKVEATYDNGFLTVALPKVRS